MSLILLLLAAGCGDGGRADGGHRMLSAPIRHLSEVAQSPVENEAEAPPDDGVNQAQAALPPPVQPARDAQAGKGSSPPVGPGYYAIGTEPFWAVTVRETSASVERPDKAPVRVAVSREEDGGKIRYAGDGFTMTVTPGSCSDGMSDAVWSDQVALNIGDSILKGCGGRRNDPQG